VYKPGSDENMSRDKREISQKADDDISDKSDNDSDGTATAVEPESSVTVAAWNIHGLASYKQNSLLGYAAASHLDVLAVCETHLLNSEQLVQWQLCVDQPDSRYCWYGRAAVRAGPNERGRGSGGVGLLIRRDWRDFCSPAAPCEHPCLLFVRLDLPNAPHPFFVGVAYAVPIGSARQDTNQHLLTELAELCAQYQRSGMVLVCGDFNTHIACIPSQLLSVSRLSELELDGSHHEADLEEVTVLDRISVDVPPGALVDEVPPAGAAFMDQLDAAGLVVLNGLCAVGDGARAEATFGVRSVIDLILVSTDHWRLMDSVRVLPDARAWVSSDHELIFTKVRYRPADVRAPAGAAEGQQDGSESFPINSTRYSTATKGNPHHFTEYEQACRAVLPELTQSWADRACGGEIDGLSVEDAWAEFTSKLATVCASTLGIRKQRVATGQRIRIAHAHVRQWCHQRRLIWSRIHQLLPSQWKLRRTLEQELKPLSTKIKHRLREQLRVEQQRALQQVERLRRTQLREHWKQLKRVGNLQPKQLSVPAAVVDPAGTEYTEAAEVREQWRQAWGRLAEHRAADARYDAEFHAQVERDECIEPEDDAARAFANSLNCDITLEEVRESLRRLHRGKAVGSDGISAEVLKEGGPAMVESIHYLCSLAFIAAEVPMDWLRGVVVPLHKDGDRRAPLNYRPITLLSLVGKVYTGVLCVRLTQWAEQRGVIVDEQGGFRAGRGCPEQVFALTELIKMRQRAKLDT